MTFLQALYGSQYAEITKNGKDGAKGRFNGNIFLAAFIVLGILTIGAILITISPSLSHSFSRSMEHTFGYNNGKAAGKLLAIPIMALCYFLVAYTVGTEASYNRLIDEFNLLPAEERAKANKKVLVPFFVVLVVFFVLLMSSLANL